VRISESTLSDAIDGLSRESAECETGWASDYFENHRRRYEETARVLMEADCGRDLLSVGATPGHLVVLLSRVGYSVSAVDVDSERIHPTIGKELAEIKSCDIEVEPTPFPNDSFDGVVMAEVLEHLRIDPLYTLREVRWVLRPDGVLLVTTPNLHHLARMVNYVKGSGVMWSTPVESYATLETKGHMGHNRVYTSEDLIETLEYCGFGVDSVEYMMMEWDYWESGERGSSSVKSTVARVLCERVPRLRKALAAVATPDV
jgi:2-polyprenyl-3-methyl-5-hydroxy-6-metoxy-1,4-benzoquinol methylase